MPKSGIDARRQAALREGGAAYLARRQEIVKAAATVFRQSGFEATTLLDVANMLGTDRASLYYYVGSKEELLQEIVRDALENMLNAAEAIEQSAMSTTKKIQALIESMVSNYAENYPQMSIYTEGLPRIAREDSKWAVDVLDQTRRYEAIVNTVLAEGRRDGTLRNDLPDEVSLFALFGMVNWMHRWYRPTFEVGVEQISHTFIQIFLNGCGARPE